MNLLNVYEPKAVIVIEIFADNMIKQSSNLFCGACGRICAIVKEDLEFDFRFNDLKKVSNSFFLFENKEGVSCSRCQSHLFDGASSISFTTLEQFQEFQAGAFGRKMAQTMKTGEKIEGLDKKIVEWDANKEEENATKNDGKITEFNMSDEEEKEPNKVSAKIFKLKPKK